MKEIINLKEISPQISTSYHLKDLQRALDQLQTSFFQKKQTFVQTLDQEIPFPLSETLKKVAVAHEVDLQNTEDVNEFINKLRDELQQIRRLTITMSIQPTLALIKEINRWIILNLKQVVVLDFVTDQTLIGGAIVEFNGVYKDYSVKHLMENQMIAASKS